MQTVLQHEEVEFIFDLFNCEEESHTTDVDLDDSSNQAIIDAHHACGTNYLTS